MSDFSSLIPFLDSFLDSGLPGFDCAIYHRGECVLRHGGGYADRENGIPIRGDELYNIYSCTKPITAAAVMMLYERGLLSLEDRLADYIPEFAEMYVADGKKAAASTDGIAAIHGDGEGKAAGLRRAETPITIRHLLSMKAGFSYDMNSPSIRLAKEETDGRCPTLETVKYLAREPLCFEPGTNYGYSLAHDVLAAVIEVITGKRFGQFVKENIFDPLGMKNATLCLPDSRLAEVSPQYFYHAETKTFENVGRKIRFYKLGTEYESGGAGGVCTVDDYVKFLEGMRTFALLKPETVALMTTPQVTEQQYVSDLFAYGLGVRCPKAGSPATDYGWGGAAGAYLAVDPTYEFTFFYVQHAIACPVNRSAELTGKIREIIRG